METNRTPVGSPTQSVSNTSNTPNTPNTPLPPTASTANPVTPVTPVIPVAPVYIQNNISPVRKGNSIGTAGFTLAIIAFCLDLIPVVGIFLGGIIWLLGAIFSVIGIFRKPRELAIAGTCISFFWIVFTILMLGILAEVLM